MNESKSGQSDKLACTSSLIAGMTKKMANTYISGTVCAAVVVIIDSLVAGISIGSDALAAIAAAGPLLTVPQILHCLLGFGVDKLMVQEIGKGRRREANRIFGSVLIAVIVVFALAFTLIIVLERPLLELIMTDAALIDMVIDYTFPLLATAPVFEVFLCIERAFRIDGRAKLFSRRGVVANVANILLDLLLVSALQLGIFGLAWASVISAAIGYAIPLSHFFSKKRTVSPDLSVLFSVRELLSHVRSDIRLGSSATLDELMGGVVLAAQTAVFGAVGGSGGLAIWAVYKSLRGVIVSVGNGASASVSMHAGLLYGRGDYEGVRNSVKTGVRIALIASICSVLSILLLADLIAVIYGLEPEIQALGAQCFRIGCPAFPALALLMVVTSYLPAVNEVKLANRFVIVQHGLTIVPAIFGYALGLQSFFASYVGAVCVGALVMVVLLVRDRFWFVPERNPEAIAGYSIQLEPGQISAMSADAYERLNNLAYPSPLCSKVALVIEDCMSFIAQHNSSTEIDADIGLRRRENDVLVTVIDNGTPYNPIASPEGGDWSTPGTLEAIVVLGFTAETSYDRVLELNYLSLLVKPTVPVRSSQNEEAGDGPSI